MSVTAAVGRCGPYVRHDGVFVSIPKGMAPETITLQEAETLIADKRAKAAASHIKSFPEMPGLEVIDGRYGPYLAYKPEGAKKAVNYKIPKTVADPAALSIEEVRAIIAEQDAKPKKATTRRKKS